jgi:translation initiation factor 2 subunit 3
MEIPKKSEINIGVIGHVDHGKTSITYSLTGKWTDTYEEEITRGISIYLGYADAIFRKCPNCDTYTTEEYCPNCGEITNITRRVSFVDAPGHEELLTTMLSGAAIMDGAMLVIAANEGIQPQTYEHLMAAKINGVKNLVVIQNKIDLVSKEEALKNYEEIKNFLAELGYENIPIIPTSAHYGINKEYIIQAIEEFIPTPKRDESKDFIMPVVRSFDINLSGTDARCLKGGVLGGSVLQGKIEVGDEIEISPWIGNPVTTEVVSISSGDSQLECATPGGLVGIETKIDPAMAAKSRLKGQIVGEPGKLPKPTNKIEVEFYPLERKLFKVDKKLMKGDKIIVVVGALQRIAQIDNIKDNVLELTLNGPVVPLKNQKVAILIRDNRLWLYGYGNLI